MRFCSKKLFLIEITYSVLSILPAGMAVLRPEICIAGRKIYGTDNAL